ncbi:MAG: ribosomal protein L7/L12 [Myxococcaceae bacterium]
MSKPSAVLVLAVLAAVANASAEGLHSFAVRLEAAGPNKIQVIKIVREATGLGLKETKDLVEAAPKIILAGRDMPEAELLVKRLLAAGASASVLGSPGMPRPPEPQPTRGYSVSLTSFGPNKISVIKEVRAATGLGLKETKDMVEAAPKTVKSGLTAAQAAELVAKLKAAGATALVVAPQ